MSQPEAAVSRPGTVRSILRPLVSRQTYKNLGYLLLAFPLGFAYAMGVTFGLVFGLLLFVVGIGIVIMIVTLLGVRAVARFERALANRLLRVELGAYDEPHRPGDLVGRTRAYLDAPATWRGLGFVQLKFLLGLLGLVVLFALWNAIQLVAAPVRYPTTVEFGELNGEPVVWTIEALPESLGAFAVGVVAAVVVLHVANGLAYVAERMAEALLGVPTA